uniref:phospholipase A2 n=1 Tax=Cacopsylla melanoneura TaxID=428564 RepID=A0A8D8S4F5_9HEMI
MDPPPLVYSALLLLLISTSTIKSDDQPVESGYSGILQSMKDKMLGGTESSATAATPNESEVKDSTGDSSVYSFIRSIPLLNYDVNITFDSSKLQNVVSSIGKTTTGIKDATKEVLKTPLEVLSAVKNTTTTAKNVLTRSDNSSLLDIANSIPIINQFGPKITEIRNQIQFIKPGTKWCGTGDIARDFDDTGIFHDIDSCCRSHDLCPENIVAKSSKYNLTNDGSFTRSSCNCDLEFYKCLKEASNPLAIEVGIAYFDILKPLCFRFDFPMLGCKKYFGDTDQCIEFEVDLKKSKQWQWVPSPSFAL